MGNSPGACVCACLCVFVCVYLCVCLCVHVVCSYLFTCVVWVCGCVNACVGVFVSDVFLERVCLFAVLCVRICVCGCRLFTYARVRVWFVCVCVCLRAVLCGVFTQLHTAFCVLVCCTEASADLIYVCANQIRTVCSRYVCGGYEAPAYMQRETPSHTLNSFLTTTQPPARTHTHVHECTQN